MGTFQVTLFQGRVCETDKIDAKQAVSYKITEPNLGPLVKNENTAEIEILSRLGYSTIYT